jgi:hypothetical protein
MHYEVFFEPFTERHFIKTFSKKYKNAWTSTYKGLVIEFTFFDFLFEKKIAETIIDSGEIKICKTEFKIVGTNESRHSSGNRCIVALHKKSKKINVLLVYHKNDLGKGQETAEWNKMVKNNYKEYEGIL